MSTLDQNISNLSPNAILNNFKNRQLENGFVPSPPSNREKWIISLIAGIIFALVASPAAFGLTNRISTKIGGPLLFLGAGATTWGLIIHAIVFALIIRLLMF